MPQILTSVPGGSSSEQDLQPPCVVHVGHPQFALVGYGYMIAAAGDANGRRVAPSRRDVRVTVGVWF